MFPVKSRMVSKDILGKNQLELCLYSLRGMQVSLSSLIKAVILRSKLVPVLDSRQLACPCTSRRQYTPAEAVASNSYSARNRCGNIPESWTPSSSNTSNSLWQLWNNLDFDCLARSVFGDLYWV